MRNETDFFHAVIDEIKSLKTRPEISTSEIPAPQRLAPFAYAISADLMDGDLDVATGRGRQFSLRYFCEISARYRDGI
ncbi:MAG: hypothetical protein RL733_1434 [Actinomycetota bacterium]